MYMQHDFNSIANITERFAAKTEQENQAARRLLLGNETVRPKNLDDCKTVMENVLAILSNVKEIDWSLTESICIDSESHLSKNPFLVSFEAMYYLKNSSTFSRNKEAKLEKQMKAFSDKVYVHRFSNKLYVSIVFDKHSLPAAE